jgi:hypothetical protein
MATMIEAAPAAKIHARDIVNAARILVQISGIIKQAEVVDPEEYDENEEFL